MHEMTKALLVSIVMILTSQGVTIETMSLTQHLEQSCAEFVWTSRGDRNAVVLFHV